jgi:hypothetical protein
MQREGFARCGHVHVANGQMFLFYVATPPLLYLLELGGHWPRGQINPLIKRVGLFLTEIYLKKAEGIN